MVELEKQTLRQHARQIRAQIHVFNAGHRLAGHVVDSRLLPPFSKVAAFWPMRDEIDTRPMLHALHEAGHSVLLPETPAHGECLIYRRWRPDSTILPGRFGTHYVDGEIGTPEILFVPLLAFDRRGGRLGYGGGFYDRTLAALPGHRAIGCAYAAQEVSLVPTAPHDMRLHAVVTETGVIGPFDG